MSTTEVDPSEVVCAAEPGAGVEILEPRDVPLGGPRAMGVRRTLPQRRRSLIGAWCFVDHYGPERTAMVVPPHPHTGLQTVSWLFEGEIEHRDSVGSRLLVVPGDVDLMTAGSGIQHSEISTERSEVLHGVQLWVALPEGARHQPPFFETHSTDAVALPGATLRVFAGSLGGSSSPLRVFSPLVGAQLDLEPGAVVELPVHVDFEHGVLLDTGDVSVEGVTVPLHHLAYVSAGLPVLRLVAGPEGARVVLIGGVPFGERIVMWWNFIGRSHEEVVAFREEWEAASERFGSIPDDLPRLPAPALPNVRLRPRD